MSKVDDIKKLFSRFDFIGRVNISQYLSFCSIDSATNYKKRIKKVNSIFPWNADVIILIALLEINDSVIQKKPFSHECFNYINKCQSIIDHTSFPKDWLLNIDELGGHAVFGPLFLQQRHYQEYIYSKLFRYYCIFNYDATMKDFFKRKTGVENYLYFSYFALMPHILKEAFDWNNDLETFNKYQGFVELLLNMNSVVVKYLSISYEEFIQQTKDKCNVEDLQEIIYSYKVLNERPIISIGGKNYLISSHDFDYVCTDGLFTTITFLEDDIKNHIGKYAMEDYLYKIAKESGLYTLVDENNRRARFKYEKNWNDPADLVFKNNDYVVIVESKECVHIRKSWINDIDAIKSEYETCIEGVTKFIKLYRKFKGGYYNPFDDQTDKNKEVFLIYLTLQYFPYYRDKIIDRVAINDDEKAFLNNHLFIMDYYTFEIYLLYKTNIISALKQFSLENRVAEFGTEGHSFNNEDRIQSFKDFVNEMNELAFKQLDEIAFSKYGMHLK